MTRIVTYRKGDCPFSQLTGSVRCRRRYDCLVRGVTWIGVIVATTVVAAVSAPSPAWLASYQSVGQSLVGVLDEHPAIQYASRTPRDRVAALSQAVATARTRLAFEDRGGYLRSVLSALGLTVDSQLLVFSKTGVQRSATGPRTPRAIYFDDSVVVGYIP